MRGRQTKEKKLANIRRCGGWASGRWSRLRQPASMQRAEQNYDRKGGSTTNAPSWLPNADLNDVTRFKECHIWKIKEKKTNAIWNVFNCHLNYLQFFLGLSICYALSLMQRIYRSSPISYNTIREWERKLWAGEGVGWQWAIIIRAYALDRHPFSAFGYVRISSIVLSHRCRISIRFTQNDVTLAGREKKKKRNKERKRRK